jgi:hypothetical protein
VGREQRAEQDRVAVAEVLLQLRRVYDIDDELHSANVARNAPVALPEVATEEDGARIGYQMRTRSAGTRYSFRAGSTSKAEYQASTLRTVAERYSAGAC